MGDKEACDECKHKCLLTHGMRADPSPPVFTFNKILFGGYDISKDLCLPQKIKGIPDFDEGNKFILQDTNGRRWKVTLGLKDDHLAFREGWDKFYKDHGLTIGYVLAFHYIMNFHFIVNIFDKTGFEKLSFPIANGEKRKKSEIDGNCNAIGESQNHSNHSSKNQGAAFSGTSDSEAKTHRQPMSKDKPSSLENGNGKYQHIASANCDEEHNYMLNTLNRDDGSKEAERIHVLNLSNSEMPCGVDHDGSSDKKTRRSNTAAKSDAFAGNINENSVSGKVVRGEQAAEVDASTLSNNNNITSERENVAEFDNDYHKRDQVYNSECRIKCSTASWKRVRKETARSGKKSKKYPTKTYKKAGQIFGGDERDNEVPKVMKTEHVDSVNDDSLDASAFSFTAIVKSNEHLELEVTLCADIEEKVIYLEGPDEKVWPVLYLNKQGIKALTSGWENFCMSNQLQIGDACAFTLKNEVKTIFRINKVEKE